ncbi:MAG: sulfatase-like hydrolase/transferase [Bacteroidota bacterium]
MNRILVISFLFFLVIYSCSEKEEVKQPNILIFLADDLGSTDLGCYGGKAKSPHLDNCAGNGMKFTHFYAPAPNCSPSRAGLLTGRMPSRVGMYSYRRDHHTMHLPGSEITIAELLKEKNYQTAHFGKWHLSCLPQDSNLNQPQPIDQGFDYSLGTENNAIPSHLNPNNFVRNSERVGETDGYSCQLVAAEVKTWFQNFYKMKKPFFMYVAFHEVHAKIASPKNLIDNYPDETKREAEYLANIENMDNAAGKILEELENRGLLENTLVIFASDNGPYKNGSAGNLRGLKGEVYDGGIRVPAIFYWPGKIEGGTINETPASLVDVLPTLAEVCDFSIPANRKIDGANLTPLFNNKPLSRQTPLMWFFYRSYPEVSMRIDDYILIGNALDSVPRTHPMADLDMDFIKNIEIREYELYNIIDDPAQQNNLAETNPDVLNRMKPQMINLLEEIKTEGPYWNGLFEYESLASKFKKGYIRK